MDSLALADVPSPVGKWQFAIKRRCYRKGRRARFSVHGSELKCKYLIKVNPGQVNKPGTQRTEKEIRVREVQGSAMARGARDGKGEDEVGWGGRWEEGGGRRGEESEISIVVLRGAFYCRFLLAE